MRIERLSSIFKDYSFLVNNRNPYAYCSSVLYRIHDADDINMVQRMMLLEKCTEMDLS